MKKHRHKFTTGVVHSFDGSIEEALELIELDLYIGINGCSLKTQENLEVVKTIPLERILIETDAPWCEIRPSHQSYAHLLNSLKNYEMTLPNLLYEVKRKDKYFEGCMVKSRNEPCCLLNVLLIIAELHNRPLKEVAEVIYRTSLNLFFPKL